MHTLIIRTAIALVLLTLSMGMWVAERVALLVHQIMP